ENGLAKMVERCTLGTAQREGKVLEQIKGNPGWMLVRAGHILDFHVGRGITPINLVCWPVGGFRSRIDQEAAAERVSMAVRDRLGPGADADKVDVAHGV